tara:strand:- start:21219 stop:21479 length:261 start_codon:yes stop_codon:yes gene_type:complete
MIQFKYNDVMNRYDVKVPYVLADESSNVVVASISEDKSSKITLHRELSISLLKQILLRWDEYNHMMSRELEDLLTDKPKNKKKGKK